MVEGRRGAFSASVTPLVNPKDPIPMTTIVKSVVGALLAVLGLVLTVIGAWFATQLGSSGTAQFIARPATTDPVIIRPSVLNRVESDVVVTATPAEGATVWMALANPSDAADVLGDARIVSATGVGVRDWVLLTRTVGSGEPPALGLADLWRQQDSAQGPVTLTVKQAQAPEALVIASEGGTLETVTFTVTDKTWFVEAVVAVLAGLFLVVAGVALAWPSRRSTEEAPTEEVTR